MGYTDREKATWKTLEVDAGGACRTLRYSPTRDGGLDRVVRADLSQDGDFLYVIGETKHTHEPWGLIALLVVARRDTATGVYWAGLVHDMFPLSINDMFGGADASPDDDDGE